MMHIEMLYINISSTIMLIYFLLFFGYKQICVLFSKGRVYNGKAEEYINKHVGGYMKKYMGVVKAILVLKEKWRAYHINCLRKAWPGIDTFQVNQYTICMHALLVWYALFYQNRDLVSYLIIQIQNYLLLKAQSYILIDIYLYYVLVLIVFEIETHTGRRIVG